jgi:hypothetical protein
MWIVSRDPGRKARQPQTAEGIHGSAGRSRQAPVPIAKDRDGFCAMTSISLAACCPCWIAAGDARHSPPSGFLDRAGRRRREPRAARERVGGDRDAAGPVERSRGTREWGGGDARGPQHGPGLDPFVIQHGGRRWRWRGSRPHAPPQRSARAGCLSFAGNAGAPRGLDQHDPRLAWVEAPARGTRGARSRQARRPARHRWVPPRRSRRTGRRRGAPGPSRAPPLRRRRRRGAGSQGRPRCS